MKKILYTILFLFISSQVLALDIIPNLKVYGGTTRAAYEDSTDPTIYIVNSLTATAAITGPTALNGVNVYYGGIQTILEAAGNNKMIIFGVSGYIPVDDTIRVITDNITIAGQTAPSPGVTLRNMKLILAGDDIMVQHIRIRMDDDAAGPSYDSRDALNLTSSTSYTYMATNVVVDHVSLSWATDENMGIGGPDNSNISVSNSLIYEGLHNSNHSEGEHSRGVLVDTVNYLSFINNILAHNYDRNPAFNAHLNLCLTANNLIYNPGNINTYIGGGTAHSKYGFVGNVVIGGSDSGSYADSRYPTLIFNQDNDVELFIDDNRIEELGEVVYTQTGPTDWTKVRLESGSDDETECLVAAMPFAYPSGYTPMDSADVETYVKANAGARPADRDTADTRIINDITNGTGSLIDSPDDVGWPALAENTDAHADFPADPHADDDSDGYTNLEEWIHDFAAIVEGNSVDPQNVSPADDDTGVSITASATCYLSPLIDSVDIWIDTGACDGTPDGVADSDDDADGTYDMSTLVVNTAYCLTYRSNYEGTTGDYVQSDFFTGSGPPIVAESLSGIVINSGAGHIAINTAGPSIVNSP